MLTKHPLLFLKKDSFVTPQGCLVLRTGQVTDRGFEVRHITLSCPTPIQFHDNAPTNDVLAFRRTKYAKLI